VLHFGNWLVQPSPLIPAIPQNPAWGEPTAEEDAWADDWIRRFYRKPDLSPLTPGQRYVLAPRFRYALIETGILTAMLPEGTEPDPEARWTELLITKWNSKYRAIWLVAPDLPEDDQHPLNG